MAEKKACECLCCNHPIIKMLAEFYFLVWGVIGILFLIGMIWGMISLKSWQTKGLLAPGMMTQQQTQIPSNCYR